MPQKQFNQESALAEQWEFEEALECFKVIGTSLRCIYKGEKHMHRPLAAQLNILLCDSSKPLLLRLFSDLQLPKLQRIKPCDELSSPSEIPFLNTLPLSGTMPASMTVSCMPFEVTRFFNGVEDCRVLLTERGQVLPLKQWVEQVVAVHPVRVSIRQLIRIVADRAGEGQFPNAGDGSLIGKKFLAPSHHHFGALAMVAIGRLMQEIGQSVIQLYERNGPHGSLPLFDFNPQHPAVLNAACVPREYYKQPHEVLQLVSLSPG